MLEALIRYTTCLEIIAKSENWNTKTNETEKALNQNFKYN